MMPFFDRLDPVLRHYRGFELFAPEHQVPLLSGALRAIREKLLTCVDPDCVAHILKSGSHTELKSQLEKTARREEQTPG